MAVPDAARDAQTVAGRGTEIPPWGVFVLRRLLSSILLLLLLTLITFLAFSRIPSQPASFLIDIRYATPADIAHANHVLGTDRPIYVQYGRFVWRLLHGDLGRRLPQGAGGVRAQTS